MLAIFVAADVGAGGGIGRGDGAGDWMGVERFGEAAEMGLAASEMIDDLAAEDDEEIRFKA